MKKIVALFAGTLVASAALADGRVVTIPSLDNIKEISLGFSSAWYARLSPNGWGQIAIAGGGMMGTDTKEGALSFEEIYNLLVPHLRAKREYVEDVGVFFVRGVSPEGMPFGGEDGLTTRKP